MLLRERDPVRRRVDEERGRRRRRWRASTSSRVAAARERHVPLRAGRARSRRRRARRGSGTPAGPKPRPGSSHAGVTIASPAAIRGSHSPLLRVGAGAREHAAAHHRADEVGRRRERRDRAPRRRPTPSSIDMPEPPYSLGQHQPEQVELAELLPELRRSSRPGRPPARATTVERRRGARRRPRTISRSISCSGVKSRSISARLCSGAPVVAAAAPGVVVGVRSGTATRAVQVGARRRRRR